MIDTVTNSPSEPGYRGIQKEPTTPVVASVDICPIPYLLWFWMLGSRQGVSRTTLGSSLLRDAVLRTMQAAVLGPSEREPILPICAGAIDTTIGGRRYELSRF